MLTIAIIDDHIELRQKISNLLSKPPLGYSVFQYDNGQDFINKFSLENYIPSIILMDIRMSPMNGYETTAWVKKQHLEIPILAFTVIQDIEAIKAIAFKGAMGVIDKNFGKVEKLDYAINKVIKGERYFDSVEIHKTVMKHLSMNPKLITEGLSALTKKEEEIVKTVEPDKSHDEKADEMFISVNTYKKHLQNIFQKLSVSSIYKLKKLAYRLGLIDSLE